MPAHVGLWLGKGGSSYGGRWEDDYLPPPFFFPSVGWLGEGSDSLLVSKLYQHMRMGTVI